MTQHLPTNLLALFAPRPPIPYVEPVELKPRQPYTGLADFIKNFETTVPEKPLRTFETRRQRKERVAAEKITKNQKRIEEETQKYDPEKDSKATSDPFKTVVVARLSYYTTEHKLKREFEQYGPIKKTRIIFDKNGKNKGYGFVEFERDRDARAAWKYGDGKKLDGKRILVDVERSRVDKTFKPRRLGGGLGLTRAKPEERKFGMNARPPLPEAIEQHDKMKEEKRKERSRSRSRSKERKRRERSRSPRDGKEHRRERSRSPRGEKDKSKDRRERSRSPHRRRRERSRERSDAQPPPPLPPPESSSSVPPPPPPEVHQPLPPMPPPEHNHPPPPPPPM